MKKSKSIKLFIVLLISIVLLLGTNYSVFADNTSSENLTDLTSNYLESKNNTSTNTNSANSTNNTSLTNAINNTTNNTTNKTNSSLYNNTNLPKTGVQDSAPVVVLIVVFAISAGYAYKKIKEYKNI